MYIHICIHIQVVVDWVVLHGCSNKSDRQKNSKNSKILNTDIKEDKDVFNDDSDNDSGNSDNDSDNDKYVMNVDKRDEKNNEKNTENRRASGKYIYKYTHNYICMYINMIRIGVYMIIYIYTKEN
jgi:hypothetical protein